MAPDTITLTYRRVANFRALHTSWITSLAFSPDGGVLASAGADGVIFFIDVPRRRPFCCLDFEHPQTATCLLWPSSDELIVGRSDGAVQMFKIDAEKVSSSSSSLHIHSSICCTSEIRQDDPGPRFNLLSTNPAYGLPRRQNTVASRGLHDESQNISSGYV